MKKTLWFMWVLWVITLLLWICNTPASAESPSNIIKRTVHEIANQARSLGLAEDDPIILRAKELWHEADFKSTYQADAEMIAKTMYNEGRGIPSKTEQACIAWCILNRVDNNNSTVSKVLNEPYQFAYSSNTSVTEELLTLAYDVLGRWERERSGETEVGRVLPKDYLWFGGDGKHNYFRNTYKLGNRWQYTLTSPYES